MWQLFGWRERKREKRDELLSAYLDGELSPRERKRLEARLADDPELRAELEALRRTVSLVHGLPPVSVPRNFILSPSMVERLKPVPAARPQRVSPARAWTAPLLTAATAVVSLLFVVVLAGDLLLPGVGGLASAPQAPPQVEEAPAVALEAAPKEEAEAERAIVPTATPLPKSPTETPPEERPAAAVEEERHAERVSEAAEATVPAEGGGGPTEEAAALAPTAVLTVTEESVVIPTPQVEATLAPREDVGVVEPTPEEPVEATPPMAREEERWPLGRGPRLPPGLPWRALEIALGLGTVGLAFATIQAWRTRRR